MNNISKNSPKNKFRASIYYDKPLLGIGSASSAHGMTLDSVKHSAELYTNQADKNKVGWQVTIYENKDTYPKFNWVQIFVYQSGKMKKELSWLKKNKSFLSIKKIEEDIGCSQGTVDKFLKEERGLPQQWEKPLIEWVRKFIKLKVK